MSKIICDVCGTSYPETAVQCPICGCVRPGEVKVVAGDTAIQPEEKIVQNYTHVKGGRFSKANVRKRNSARDVDNEQDNLSEDRETEHEQEPKQNGKNKTDIGLTITVIALLFAIVAVVAYIVVRFFVPAFTGDDKPSKATKPETNTTIFAEDTTTDESGTTATTIDETISTDFYVDELVELTQENETFQVAVVGAADGETVAFVSEDETVAIVDENGVITAISEGEVIIKVICGDKEAICKVVVSFSDNATDPTEDVTAPEEETTAPEDEITTPEEETTVPSESIDLNYTISHEEVTLLTGVADRKSFVLTLKDEQGNTVDVEWRDDRGLCKINGNTITAEKVGSTKIYAVINGVEYPEYSCSVIIWYDV